MWFVLAMLGNALWSISDVIASMILNRIQKSEVLIAWLQSCMQLLLLGVLYALLPIDHAWVAPFALSGLSAYIASLFFFRLLQKVDVSVSSVAWVFLSLGIAGGSIFFFEETWSLLQSIGAVMSIMGALSLALWHKRIDRLGTSALLCTTGVLYVPSFLIQKAAFLDGMSLLTVFFWPGFFYCLYATVFPLLLPSYRRQIRPFLSRLKLLDHSLVFLWTCVGTMGYLVMASAYKAGDASLVGIAENGQPFFLIFFAWIALRISPNYAPKEILSAQTVGVKIVTFVVVFTGLSLLVL